MHRGYSPREHGSNIDAFLAMHSPFQTDIPYLVSQVNSAENSIFAT